METSALSGVIASSTHQSESVISRDFYTMFNAPVSCWASFSDVHLPGRHWIHFHWEKRCCDVIFAGFCTRQTHPFTSWEYAFVGQGISYGADILWHNFTFYYKREIQLLRFGCCSCPYCHFWIHCCSNCIHIFHLHPIEYDDGADTSGNAYD